MAAPSSQSFLGGTSLDILCPPSCPRSSAAHKRDPTVTFSSRKSLFFALHSCTHPGGFPDSTCYRTHISKALSMNPFKSNSFTWFGVTLFYFPPIKIDWGGLFICCILLWVLLEVLSKAESVLSPWNEIAQPSPSELLGFWHPGFFTGLDRLASCTSFQFLTGPWYLACLPQLLFSLALFFPQGAGYSHHSSRWTRTFR